MNILRMILLDGRSVRAFESFNSRISIEMLNHIKENDEKEIIRIEAKRSLNIIKYLEQRTYQVYNCTLK